MKNGVNIPELGGILNTPGGNEAELIEWSLHTL